MEHKGSLSSTILTQNKSIILKILQSHHKLDFKLIHGFSKQDYGFILLIKPKLGGKLTAQFAKYIQKGQVYALRVIYYKYEAVTFVNAKEICKAFIYQLPESMHISSGI